MRQFEISVENKIGALAALTNILAQAKVNLKAIATDSKDGIGLIKIVTDDEKITRDILKQTGFFKSGQSFFPLNNTVKLSKLLSCKYQTVGSDNFNLS